MLLGRIPRLDTGEAGLEDSASWEHLCVRQTGLQLLVLLLRPLVAKRVMAVLGWKAQG